MKQNGNSTFHEQMGTLNVKEVSQLCPRCDFGAKCPEKENPAVYCQKVYSAKSKADFMAGD